MESIKIKAKKEQVFVADMWTATSECGNFSSRAFTQDEAVEMVILKILYAELGKPKIISISKLLDHI
jgi:hypothetical protein